MEGDEVVEKLQTSLGKNDDRRSTNEDTANDVAVADSLMVKM